MGARFEQVLLAELETPQQDHTVVRLRIAQADRIDGLTGRLRIRHDFALHDFGHRFSASDSWTHPCDISGGPRMYPDTLGVNLADANRYARALRPIVKGLAEYEQRDGTTIRLDDTLYRLMRVLKVVRVAGQTRDSDRFDDGQTVTFLTGDGLRTYLWDLQRWYCRWPDITDDAGLAEFLNSRTDTQIARLRRDGGGAGLILAREQDFLPEQYQTFGGGDWIVLHDGTAAHRDIYRDGRWFGGGTVALRQLPATEPDTCPSGGPTA